MKPIIHNMNVKLYSCTLTFAR